MQLVGATRSFIARPFILQGITQGLYSSMIAIILLGGLLYLSRQEFPQLVNLQDLQLFLSLFVIVIVLGLIISWVSTLFAVRKYLKIKGDNLYY